MELTYHWEGDIRIPNLLPNEEPEEPLTKYGRMRLKFLEEHHRGIFSAMILEGELKAHCLMIQKQADELMETITRQMAEADGVNEELKATDQMSWVRKMNNIRYSAEEFVLREVVYAWN
ncbi:MAG: TnpV protein [Lachnospiraceae bacterium]|nr:TnpV protein [Lachnospiraceae bacterium]